MKKDDLKLFLTINDKDNVATALEDLFPGELVGELIKKGHKFSLRPIKRGERVIKYGYTIGFATRDIESGHWVHTHNMESSLNIAKDFKYISGIKTQQPQRESNLSFMGYRRNKNTVGIRNEVWIINTVGCVNKTAEMIASKANELYGGKGQNFDGVFTFPHPYGCSQLGEDLLKTQRILSALCKHPNAAGVLVLALGCENNDMEEFKKFLDGNDERYRFLRTQDVSDEINEGVKLVGELVDQAFACKREEIPLSQLKIGFKCGGSDAFSGITANPLCGRISDRLIAEGGTSVMTEVPEMFGAEEILLSRAKDRDVFDRMLGMINRFKDYFIEHGQPIYENPSPGNREGGITTLEEKSLGNVQKGGSGIITDVVDYGLSSDAKGLVLLDGPGNDGVSSTALAAFGAHIIIFTTGRGTPFGSPVPVIKVSSNSSLYSKKKNWIDYNAGSILDGKPLCQWEGELMEMILSVASGEMFTKSEINGYREIAIFKNGVTL